MSTPSVGPLPPDISIPPSSLLHRRLSGSSISAQLLHSTNLRSFVVILKMPLTAELRASLVTAGVNEKIITHLDDPKYFLTDEASFANFIEKREEIQTGILDQLGDADLQRDVGQRGLLTKVWRECEALETLRLERKARNVGPDDLEDPLPDGTHTTDITSFKSSGVHWEPALSELLCEPLYGRIKRETTSAKAHSVLPLERVRTAAEVSRTAVGKTLSMAAGVDLRVHQSSMPAGPRTGGVRDHHLMLWLIQVLFLGGWSVVGKAVSKDGKPFVSFQACMDYVRFIREHVTPLHGPLPSLARCIRSDFETRSLWASAMSRQKTLEDAMKDCAPQQAAVWLWTTESENLNAPMVPSLPQDASSRSSRRRSRSRSPAGFRQEASGGDDYRTGQYMKGLATMKGFKICQAWNNHATGCSERADKCKNGHLHICNYMYTAPAGRSTGQMCGHTGRRACNHHAQDGSILKMPSLSAVKTDDKGKDKGKGKANKGGKVR